MAALAAVALALAVVLIQFIRRPILLPVTAVALILVVLAGWVPLVSRGARRWIAATVPLSVLIGVLAFIGVKTLVGAAVVLVLVLLSGAAARVAFGHEQSLLAAGASGRRVESARRGAGVGAFQCRADDG